MRRWEDERGATKWEEGPRSHTIKGDCPPHPNGWLDKQNGLLWKLKRRWISISTTSRSSSTNQKLSRRKPDRNLRRPNWRPNKYFCLVSTKSWSPLNWRLWPRVSSKTTITSFTPFPFWLGLIGWSWKIMSNRSKLVMKRTKPSLLPS